MMGKTTGSQLPLYKRLFLAVRFPLLGCELVIICHREN